MVIKAYMYKTIILLKLKEQHTAENNWESNFRTSKLQEKTFHSIVESSFDVLLTAVWSNLVKVKEDVQQGSFSLL